MKTIKFKVTLTCWEKELVWRIIEIPEDKTLHQLHLYIQKSFGFYNDHLYSFFMSNTAWDRKSEFTSPVEIEESEAPSATGVKLRDLKLSLKKKFLYLYDFGDNLDLQIEVMGFGEVDKNYRYPQIIGAFGAAPEQYAIRRADMEEEDEEYFDDCPTCQGLKKMGLKHDMVDIRTGKIIKPKRKSENNKLEEDIKN